ncbi:hypothetical protein pb186bvf_018281 [Paramecium bursaria]
MIQILLIRILYAQITTLEDGYVCNVIPCGYTDYIKNPYKYGTDDYGDLSLVSDFTLTFQVLVGAKSSSAFLLSLLNEQSSGLEYKVYLDSLSTPQQIFILDNFIVIPPPQIVLDYRGWFLIAISQQSTNHYLQKGLMISNYETSTTIANNFVYQPYHKFNLFQQDSSNYWNGWGCCVVMYYGINLIDSINPFSQFMYINFRKPELMVHLNIQELSQPKITADYSQYKNIAKLGNEFAFQDDDPILRPDGGLLFNSSQFIIIDNFKYNLYFTFEFRIILSSTFLSEIILADFQSISQRVIIYIKQDKFILQFGELNKTVIYIANPVIHFSVSLIRLNANIYQYSVLFNQYQNGDIIKTAFEHMIVSTNKLQSRLGKFYIGSKQNQFTLNEYFILLIFRHYQGFFIDQAQKLNPFCKLYLGDTCIKCNSNYYLSIFDDQCVQVSNQIAQTFQQDFDQFVRKCDFKCSTCLYSDPTICLSCYGNNRINPPQCNCPPQYFEDSVHPDCKQFIPDRAFETGKTIARCSSLGQQLNSIITSQNSYTSEPNILVFLSSIYNPCNNQQVKYAIININNQQTNLQFTITASCACAGQVFQYQWSIDNGLNQKIQIQQSLQSIQSPQTSLYVEIDIQEGILYDHIITSVMGWRFTLAQGSLIPYFEVQTYQTVLEDVLQYLFFQNLLTIEMNVFYTNYFTFNLFQDGVFNNFVTQNMPEVDKSIQYIMILQEFQNFDDADISYTLDQKERQLNSIKFRTPKMIEQVNATIIFAVFQCIDKQKPCDFYDFYNLNCILSRLCSCDTIGYYQNQTMFCQKCNQNCYQCEYQSNYCTACYPNSNAQLTNNACTCQQSQYLYENNTCKDCPPLCITCTQINRCQSCKQYSYLQNQLCQCLEGYYYSSNYKICLECNNLCQTCLDSQSCNICKPNSYLFQNQCLCDKCYYQNQNQCQSCQLKDSLTKIACQFSQCKSQLDFYCFDDNIIPKDGCFNNLIQHYWGCLIEEASEYNCYKCPNQCNSCIIQLNLTYCLECDQGYFNSNYDCIKCYDPSCRFCTSIYNCQICNNNLVPNQGQCLQCDQGYYLQNSSCKNLCGDGIKTLEEQCDDGNQYSFDGCTIDCLIQENFICYEQSRISICFFSQPPIIYLDSVSKVSDQYLVVIHSDQEIIFASISTNFYLDNQLDNTILQSQNFSQNNILQIFKYQGYLQFRYNLDSISVRIQFLGHLSNKYDQNIVKNYIQSELKDVMILRDLEKDFIQIISKIADISIQITICISVMMVFVNGLTSVLGQINILNIFQYAQFLNIEFPPNLLFFMQSFQSYNIIEYLFGADFLINILQITIPYQKPDDIFYRKGINAFFLYNIQSYILCILLFYFLKSLQQIVPFIIKKIYFSIIPNNNRIVIRIQNTLKVISIISYKSQREQEQYGIIKLTQAMSYQILFAIFLQLKQPVQKEIQYIIPYILAVVTLMLYLKTILLSSQKIDKDLKKQPFFHIHFINIFKLTESIVYIFTLVFNQTFPIQQILLISFHQIITLIFSIYFMPYRKLLINYELISQQIGLFINHLSFILYIYNPIQSNNINIGWVQILIFFVIIIFSLMSELYMAVSYLIHLYKIITLRQIAQQ